MARWRELGRGLARGLSPSPSPSLGLSLSLSLGLSLVVGLSLAGCEGAGPADLDARELAMLESGTEPHAGVRERAGEHEGAGGSVEAAQGVASDGYVGVVLAGRSVEVRVPFTAEVVQLPVDVGDEVESGEVLARLDPRNAEDELRMSEAELRAARARRGEIDAGLAAARRTHEQALTLHRSGHASTDELAAAELRLEQLGASLARARAEIDGLATQVELQRRALQERSLTAPFAGVVAERYADPGARVGPSAPIVRLLDRSVTRIRFAVPASSRQRWARGRPLVVVSDDGARTWSAEVTTVTPEVDPVTHDVFVEGTLRLGAEPAVPHGTPVHVRLSGARGQ